MRVNNLLKVITSRKVASPGFEPATYRSRNRYANHSATAPHNCFFALVGFDRCGIALRTVCRPSVSPAWPGPAGQFGRTNWFHEIYIFINVTYTDPTYYKRLNNLTCIEPNSYVHLHYPPPSSRNPTCSFQNRQTSIEISSLHSSLVFRLYWNAQPENVKRSSSLALCSKIN